MRERGSPNEKTVVIASQRHPVFGKACYPAPIMPAHNRILLTTLVAYLVFVIYGSLVPLDFRPVALDAALARFQAIPYLDLGIGSRADWVANLLLFIPLAFLLGSLWPGHLRWPGTLVNVLFCVALSLAIEFTQIFFPPRTVSQNDILAESIGGLVGALVWLRYGEGFRRMLLNWQQSRGRANQAEKLLWVYLALLIGYNVLPLDLTFSPVELHEKWREGRILLVPFAWDYGSPVNWLYNIGTDVLIWVPVGLLGVLSRRFTPAQALRWTLLVVLGLELFQLMVFSRISDVTDLLTALPGAWLGAWLGGRLRGHEATRDRGSGITLAVLATLTYMLLLLALFLYPYEFNLRPDFIKGRIEQLFRVPFYAYYYGSEYRAITEVLHKVGFFMPLGMLLYWVRRRLFLPRIYLTWRDTLMLCVGAGLPLAIELVQLAQPGKNPDSTDLVLMLIGLTVGYLGSRRHLRYI